MIEISLIRNPTEVLRMMDNMNYLAHFQYGQAGKYLANDEETSAAAAKPQGDAPAVAYRHPSRTMNGGFFDGHVGSISEKEMTADPKAYFEMDGLVF